MGFMDKVKASVKSGAEQAATKAQEELERLQLRRELGQAYTELGEKTFELDDKGDVSHAELGPLVDKVRTLKTQLAAVGTTNGKAEPDPAAAPPAG